MTDRSGRIPRVTDRLGRSGGAEVPELSVVVPAHNSAEYIGETVRSILSFFERAGLRGELIVVDDGSTDETAGVARDAGASVLRLPVNSGKGAAVRMGMLNARGSTRAFTDADLPYGTAPFVLALRYINDRGFHAVVGDRTLPGSMYASSGIVRSLVSDVASLAFRTLVTGGIFDTQCGLKAFRGDVAAELFALSRVDGFAVDVELIYLLLKYRLDMKRLPVRLERNAPSTVRVVRDSVAALGDVLRMRINWALGRYRSPVLVACLMHDLRNDERDAERSLHRPAISGERPAKGSGGMAPPT